MKGIQGIRTISLQSESPLSPVSLLKPITKSPVFKLGIAEVDEEPHLNACRLQVVHHLRQMFRRQSFYSFQLQQHPILNYNIRKEITNGLAAEHDFQGFLRFCFQPLLLEYNQESLFIHRFEEATAEFVTDLKAGAQNLLCEFFMDQIRNPLSLAIMAERDEGAEIIPQPVSH